MAYEVVFDVATAGYRQWPYPAIGATVVALATGVAVYQRLRFPPGSLSRGQVWFPIVYGGLATVWTVATFWSTYADYRHVRNALASGSYQVVEGPVTDLTPVAKSGHGLERFVVNGHRFAYSDLVVTAGFNTTTAAGGPIRDGLQVRIADVGGEIARLEIAPGPR